MKYFFILLVLPLFALQTAVAQPLKMVVAKDGSGDFTTVQQAIDAVIDSNQSVTTIFIKKGIYKEKLYLHKAKMNVHFVGEHVDETILTYDDHANVKGPRGNTIGTSGSASFYIYADGFAAENITFENSAGPVGQAVAVRVSGDKAQFINCRFLGFQDTLYTHGDNSRQYYFKCYIEGTVDFIFGASTVLFDSCTIYGKKGGYYTAASTQPGKKFGYVFNNCTITGSADKASFFLGRPWRPDAKTVFLNCYLDKQVKAAGWDNWRNPENEKTTFYAEYNNRGPGANTAERVGWSKQLTALEAAEYSMKNILGDWIISKN